MSERADDPRKKQFKNVGRHEEMRRRRNEGSVELRKQRKDEQLMKRRNVADLSDDESQTSVWVNQTFPKKEQLNMTFTDLDHCLNKLRGAQSPTDEDMLRALEGVRRVLSKSKDPPVASVIEKGLVPFLVEALAIPNEKAQYEAAWALTNIVSGTNEETSVVVKAGGLPALAKLLLSPEVKVSEQAAWALANVAGDSGELRDQLLEAGVLAPMLELTCRQISVEFRRTLAWGLTNFVRHKRPQPTLEVLQTIIPCLVNMLDDPDKVVMVDACWGLSYISDGAGPQIDLVLNTKVLSKMIQFLCSEEKIMVTPALRTLGNIVTGTEEQTQAVIDTGILDLMEFLMESSSGSLLKECCWLLSNILAGNALQIQSVMDAGLLPKIILCLEKGEARAQLEAAWALMNASSGGTLEQMRFLIQCGSVQAISQLLHSKDPKLLHILLDGLMNILDASRRLDVLDSVCLLVEETGGLDALEVLQTHEDELLYNKALNIIDHYFADQEDKENQSPVEVEVQDPMVPKGGFQF